MAVTARSVTRLGGARSCCGHTRRTARRRSSRLQGNRNASERTHAGSDRVHGVEAVASAPLQPEMAPQVDMDALRNRQGDGGQTDAAAAARRCFAARFRSPGSAARRPCGSRIDVSLRSHRRSTCCHDRTACRRRPRPRNRRRRTLGGCPRRSIAIEGWTATRVSGDTLRSRPNGASRSRVLKEARRVATPCAGLPSCTGRWFAAPCSDRPRDRHPLRPAAMTFAAVARNQSQELRSRRWNQNQLRPPESGESRPPFTSPRVRRAIQRAKLSRSLYHSRPIRTASNCPREIAR